MLFPTPPRSAGRRGPLSPRPAPSPSPHPTPLLSVLALLALPAAGAARGGGFFPATSPHIRLVGRWAHGSGNGTVYADWSSSAIEFTAVGPVSVRPPSACSAAAPANCKDVSGQWLRRCGSRRASRTVTSTRS